MTAGNTGEAGLLAVWLLPLTDNDTSFEWSVVAWAVAFTAVNRVTAFLVPRSKTWRQRLGAAEDAGSEKERLLLINLASTIPSTVHALLIASGCLLVVLRYLEQCGHPEEIFHKCPSVEDAPDIFKLYQQLVYMSIGYFLSDTVLYSLASMDVPLLLHHLVMILAYYPTASVEVGRSVFPAGSTHFWAFIGAAAYICEFATLAINFRMVATKVVLKRHVWWYPWVNVVLLLSYFVLRLCWFPYLISEMLACQASLGTPTPGFFYAGLFAFGSLLLLSVAYMYIMLAGGWQRLTTFRPPRVHAN